MDRGWTVGWLSSTFVLALSVLILAFPAAAAATSRAVAGQPATESPPATWAFSGSQVVNQSTANASAAVSESGQYEWATVLTERSTGPFGVSLVVQRGMWTEFTYRLCAPSCLAPTYELSSTLTGFEWSQEFLNVSLQAEIPGGGTAIGLVNASVSTRSALNTSTAVTGSDSTPSGSAVAATATGTYAVAFAPAVPLAPTAPTAGTHWSGASALRSATGGWSRTTTTVNSGVPTPDARVTDRQNLTTGSSVDFSGSVGSPIGVGSSVSSFPITVTPPGGVVRFLDGVSLDVTSGSLFAPLATGVPPVSGVVELPRSVDYDTTIGAHLGFTAASVSFEPVIAAPTGSTPAPSGASVLGFEPPAWTIQGLPEPVSAAQGFFTQHGLLAPQSAVGPAVSPRSISSVPLAWIVAVGAIAGTVVALGIRWSGAKDDLPLGSRPRGPDGIPSLAPAAPTPGARAELTAPAPPAARDPFDDLL